MAGKQKQQGYIVGIQTSSGFYNASMAIYWNAGLNPIGIRSDGSKAAAYPWLDYINRRATKQEIDLWDQKYDAFALINGVISGGQETIDVDDPQCVEPLLAKIDSSLRSRLVINNTPRGGLHLPYRCKTICPSRKIALDVDGKVRIESRGERSYTIAPGSALSTHKSGKPYSIRQWHYFPHIPLITEEERKHIWQCCLAFDNTERRVEEERQKIVKSNMERYTLRKKTSLQPDEHLSKLARKMLIDAGWKTKDNMGFTRPGKSDGISGKFNRTLTDGKEIFTVFSTNAGPLAPDEGHKNYSLHHLVATLRNESTNQQQGDKK